MHNSPLAHRQVPSIVHDPGEIHENPCSSKHTWHFATGDYQFEVGFLPFLWPNAATKMQKIASREQPFVRVASGVYFEHVKPCNHNQVPISNTAGWIPLFFFPQPGVFETTYSVCIWRNSNDVSKCGRRRLLASLFQLRSPLQAGALEKKKKNVIKSIGFPPPPLSHYFSLRWDGDVIQSSFHWVLCWELLRFFLILRQQTNILTDRGQNHSRLNKKYYHNTQLISVPLYFAFP